MFPFTQGPKSAWKTPGTQAQRSGEQHPSRPHTVASFHSNEHLPHLNNSNNSAPTAARPTSAHPSITDTHSDHHSRPASGHSIHGYTASQSSAYRPVSVASVHTPPGSRPGSGNANAEFNAARSSPVQYDRQPSAHSVRSRASVHSGQSRDESMHSRGSQVSLRSRASSTTSHTGRRRVVPAATNISSAYKWVESS